MSLHFTRAAPNGPSSKTVTDAGETITRWKRSRCTPLKCAIAALIGSAWETTTMSSPGCTAITSSSAVTIRLCISEMDSPPGNRARDGTICTVRQRSVFASSAIVPPVHSP